MKKPPSQEDPFAHLYQEFTDERFVHRGEIATYSPEEAEEILAHRKSISPTALKVFGTDNYSRLKEALIDHPEANNLEYLVLTGELSWDQLNEYLMVLDEFHEMRQGLFQLADQIASNLKDKIRYNVNSAYKGRTIDTRPKLAPFLNLIQQVTDSMEPPDLSQRGQVRSFKQARALEFRNLLFARIGKIIGELLDQYPAAVKNAFVQALSFHDPKSIATSKEFPAAALIRYEDQIHNFYTAFPQFFHSIADQIQDDPTPEELEMLFEQANDLSHYRRLERHSHQTSFTEVELTLDDGRNIGDLVRPFTLAFVNLKWGKNNISLVLDRSHKEIHLGDFSLSLEDLIGEQAYHRIKKYILLKLIEYFESKDEDIERTAVEISTSIKEQPEIWELLQDRNPIPIPQEEPEIIQDELDSKEESIRSSSFDYSRLKGFSGNRVKEALINLLGQPLRVRGSHHIFACRAGGTYPISFHGSRDLGIGLLKKCLRMFGIAGQEMYDELTG